MAKEQVEKLVAQLEAEMRRAARDLEFERAAALRDEIQEIRLRVLEEDESAAVARAAERAGKAKPASAAGDRLAPARAGRTIKPVRQASLAPCAMTILCISTRAILAVRAATERVAQLLAETWTPRRSTSRRYAWWPPPNRRVRARRTRHRIGCRAFETSTRTMAGPRNGPSGPRGITQSPRT